MPWLKNTPKDFIIMRNGKKHIASDYAIGVYLESHFNNVIVDYIQPNEISTRRFKKNDIVFIIIYDLLESFHLSERYKQPQIFNRFKTALKNSPNVYPPYQYQKFINNKCTYYKYLKNRGIPVVPTQCILKKKWYLNNPEKYINTLIAKVKHNKWDSIIAKPVYGQEAIDFKKFMSCNNSLVCQKKNMLKYLQRTIPKYKAIVLQEYIKGFDKSNPEMRTYHVNGKYMYTMASTNRLAGTRPKQEGGQYNVKPENWAYLMKFAKMVMDSLPKLDLPGEYKNPILTRIDVGSGLQGTPFTYFVNEVEFVPSLYIEDQKNPVIEEISEALYNVAQIYHDRKLEGTLPVKVIF
jgi:hypothetical protein